MCTGGTLPTPPLWQIAPCHRSDNSLLPAVRQTALYSRWGRRLQHPHLTIRSRTYVSLLPFPIHSHKHTNPPPPHPTPQHLDKNPIPHPKTNSILTPHRSQIPLGPPPPPPHHLPHIPLPHNHDPPPFHPPLHPHHPLTKNHSPLIPNPPNDPNRLPRPPDPPLTLRPPHPKLAAIAFAKHAAARPGAESEELPPTQFRECGSGWGDGGGDWTGRGGGWECV